MDQESSGIVFDGDVHVVFVKGEMVGTGLTHKEAVDILDSYEIDSAFSVVM